MSFPIILDFIVVTLLIATILYAISLNRKLDALYQNREELQQFIESFSQSLLKAEISMTKLRISGEKSFSDLAEKLKEGVTLRDDLGYLLERGEKLASTLEEGVRVARDTDQKLTNNAHSQQSTKKKSQDFLSSQSSQDEPELIRSLRNVR